MTKTSKNWEAKAFKHSHDQLHRQLGIPKEEKIPIVILKRILSTPVGTHINTSTNFFKGKIVKITFLMKKRAQMLLNTEQTRR